MLKSILQGRFMNHPLHPLLVHLPIGFWVASFVFDILYFFRAAPALAAASYYCMAFGLIGAALAAVTGLAEFVEVPKASMPRRIATSHLVLNSAVTALYLVNMISRHAIEDGTPTIVLRGQFILSIFSLVVLSISGYLGGLLVYNYGIGFKPQLRDKDEQHRRNDVRRAA